MEIRTKRQIRNFQFSRRAVRSYQVRSPGFSRLVRCKFDARALIATASRLERGLRTYPLAGRSPLPRSVHFQAASFHASARPLLPHVDLIWRLFLAVIYVLKSLNDDVVAETKALQQV